MIEQPISESVAIPDMQCAAMPETHDADELRHAIAFQLLPWEDKMAVLRAVSPYSQWERA